MEKLTPAERDEITKLVDGVKEAGLWDVVAGFQYDEPMLCVTTEVFEEFSSFMATFGKRQLAIFSYYEVVEGSNPRSCDPEYGKEAHLITPESCKYLTDIGFDWYGSADINEHRTLLNEMKEKIGRSDVRIWFFPCTSKAYADQDEDYMVKHLNMCYDLLKEQENPGGLMLYTWTTYGTQTGLQELLDPNLGYNYKRLAARIVEIGKEINSNPYRYNKSKN